MTDATITQWLMAAGGAVVFLSVLAGAIVKLFQIITKIAAPHFAHAVGEALRPQLEKIDGELRFNGGSSMKDVLHATKEGVQRVTDTVDTFVEYQHANNHKVNNVLTSTLGFIKLAHPEFSTEWDGTDRRGG